MYKAALRARPYAASCSLKEADRTKWKPDRRQRAFTVLFDAKANSQITRVGGAGNNAAHSRDVVRRRGRYKNKCAMSTITAVQ